MKHLKIMHVGHLSKINPMWPLQRYNIPADQPVEIRYEHEPILQVEIAESDWNDMYKFYSEHILQHKHPAVKDAWEKYLITKAMTK